jgi:hypothetical protein
MAEPPGNPPINTADAAGSSLAPGVASGPTATNLDPRQIPTRPPSAADTAIQPAGAGDQPWTFGRYHVQRRLGQGGMGEVFRARDTQLQRTVALKIPRWADERPALRARFLREARAAASLGHPNICPVYDADEIDGRPYLTMAYVDGPPLAVRLRQSGPFAATEAAALVSTVARAMQHAHEEGILHRDLKPANILLNSRGEPVVTDFGLAFRLDTDTGERLTEQGLLVGTPSYMPPEQINGQELRPTADVYSLGMVLYKLLTGTVAFRGPLGKLLAQIETAAPVPPSQLRPGLSPALDAVCLKALAKRPQDRFATMAELAGALEGYCAGRERPGLSGATLVFTRLRRPRRWLALAAGVLCAVTAFLALHWIKPARPAADPGTPAADTGTPAKDTGKPAPDPVEVAPLLDPRQADRRLLFAQTQRPILRIEAVATDKAPLRLARRTVPEKLLGEHQGPLCFALTGAGKGHVVDLTDQSGQEAQLTSFGAGDVTVLGSNMTFLTQLGDGAQVFVKGGPGYSLLAPLQTGRGSKHVEFEGTHLLLSKVEAPTIDANDASAPERSELRNPVLTRKVIVRYPSCEYVIFTNPDVVVIPNNPEERRVRFPEVHNLVELDRARQFSARTITAQQLQPGAVAPGGNSPPDTTYAPRPEPVVDRMFALAGVKEGDVVYDLGCGDGRICAVAAVKHRCKAVGVDSNPVRIKECAETMKKYQVPAGMVDIRQGDALKVTDLDRATVIMLSMPPDFMKEFENQVEKLKPGTRIVARDYPFPNRKADEVVEFKGPERAHTLYLWAAREKR